MSQTPFLPHVLVSCLLFNQQAKEMPWPLFNCWHAPSCYDSRVERVCYLVRFGGFMSFYILATR